MEWAYVLNPFYSLYPICKPSFSILPCNTHHGMFSFLILPLVVIGIPIYYGLYYTCGNNLRNGKDTWATYLFFEKKDLTTNADQWITKPNSCCSTSNIDNEVVPKNKNSCDKKVIFLVTAHPDDESMFFLPTIRTLTQIIHENSTSFANNKSTSPTSSIELILICLCDGNYDGLGVQRRQELERCCKTHLKITQHVIIDNPSFRDGPKEIWDATEIACIIEEQVGKYGAQQMSNNTILTFDEQGVSGHPNHVATFHGICKLQQLQQKNQRLYNGQAHFFKLMSKSFLQGKYFAFLSCVRSGIRRSTSLCATSIAQDRPPSSLCLNTANDSITFAYKAMSLHESQFVWYRRLFVLFSCYTYYNEWVPLLHDYSGDKLGKGSTNLKQTKQKMKEK